MRRKLVVNSVVNPLTTRLNCPSEIFKHTAGTLIAERLCTEASFTFRTQWEQEGTEQFPRELEAAALLAQCKRIVRQLNGYLLRLARRYGVRAPMTATRYSDADVRYVHRRPAEQGCSPEADVVMINDFPDCLRPFSLAKRTDRRPPDPSISDARDHPMGPSIRAGSSCELHVYPRLWHSPEDA
ncbi:predicted protein [Postia placenta Mad-698-R]|uniref:Uncharacterized protein n=1 Tax=Postia placenta MAD-698-R-SB12 TaxID=670580 RepID=A0A1X6NFS0_9APHY|nr:hypothetical protein POSPLADRAFT_1128472 [Postia placenta MAD-698-R-SB12]EED79124.1 predicted protein [Postia placenta Mad-698-R]OSX67266.1 hypothetical protein POSPLADRAFT_1128472 [Postia placenta MAD-698-R-SB12]